MSIYRHRGLKWLAVVFILAVGLSSGGMLHAQVEAPSQEETTPQSTGELKTVAVIAVAPYEKLIADITMLGTLAGKPEAGQMIEGGLSFFTQGKGVQAIDKSKPWGVIVQTDGASFLPVGCLPITKVKDLLDVATNYGAQVKEGDDVTEVVMPNQKSMFVKPNGGWAFISVSSAALDRLPEEPQKILAELVTDYDVTARISVKDVPEMYRQFAVQAMQSGMHQQMQKKEGESDDTFEIRKGMAEAQMEQAVRTINEVDSITLGWAVDAAQQRTYLDFTYEFLAGSKMAEQIAAYGEPTTKFAGFYQPDAAATMTFVTKADPKLIEADIAQFETMMSTMRDQINKQIDESEQLEDAEVRESLKAAAGDFIDAFGATIKAGQMDGGAALHLSEDSLSFVGGALVKDPAKVESGLKKLEAAAGKKRDPRLTGVEWNAASHAGVNFHTLSVKVPADQKAPRKLLGSEANIAIGIGADSVYLAVGSDNLDAVKKAIDASAAEPDKAVPPFEFAASLGPIMEAASAQAEEGSQKQITEAVAAMLRDEAKGRDHIRAVGRVVPNGLRYRFEAEEGVLRAMGTAAAEAQRQALQAQQ